MGDRVGRGVGLPGEYVGALVGADVGATVGADVGGLQTVRVGRASRIPNSIVLGIDGFHVMHSRGQ